MVTLYGIKNCDTVKKARNWLDLQGIDYQFHDFREDGPDSKTINGWLQELGWETLVNKRSTTWKGLSPEQREAMDEKLALTAIMEQPTLIKRPLLDTGKERHTGFSVARYAEIFSRHTL
ncbi:MAG: Spx/MgsR family transcriptional regulator [Alcanivorax sp.]